MDKVQKKGDYVRQSLAVLNEINNGCYRTYYLREFIANYTLIILPTH